MSWSRNLGFETNAQWTLFYDSKWASSLEIVVSQTWSIF